MVYLKVIEAIDPVVKHFNQFSQDHLYVSFMSLETKFRVALLYLSRKIMTLISSQLGSGISMP